MTVGAVGTALYVAPHVAERVNVNERLRKYGLDPDQYNTIPDAYYGMAGAIANQNCAEHGIIPVSNADAIYLSDSIAAVDAGIPPYGRDANDIERINTQSRILSAKVEQLAKNIEEVYVRSRVLSDEVNKLRD